METLYPASNWFLQESTQSTSSWTKEENKRFESALAIFSESTPDRWIKIAAMIPGKTVLDVIKQYKELEEDVCDIEAGKVPIPGYLSSSFTLEMDSEPDYGANRKRPLVAKGSDHERKKGVPWTDEEHKRFLMGLIKYGKGDWRNISRNYVISKTPTQVASHAQKYFMRQVSGGKDKRRPSIHDITTINLTNTFSSDNHKPDHSFNQSNVLQTQQNSLTMPENGAVMASSNMLMPSSYEFGSHGLKHQGQQDLYATAAAYHGAHIKPWNPLF